MRRSSAPIRWGRVIPLCLLLLGVSQARASAPGLDERPANPTCVAPPRPGSDAPVQLGLEPAFGSQVFTNAVGLFPAPHRPGEWYLIRQGVPWQPEQIGEIWRLIENEGATPTIEVFLDLGDAVTIRDAEGIRANEAGLLGMALHPDFPTTPYVYVSFTELDDSHSGPFTSVVARFTTLDGGLTAELDSRLDILRLPQFGVFHNGGGIGFGPDGLLYVGFGDGGQPPAMRAQDTDTWFGTLLRIDVDGGAPYAIPQTNPFAEGGGAPEIYAWGLRNPWRWSFDRLTGELYVGDVGFETWEEIDRVDLGGNYGWPVFEGPLCASSNCEDPELRAPIAAHRQSDIVPPGDAKAIIGGYVYRGTAFPELQGHYVYGDINGNIWTLAPGDNSPRLQLSGVGPILSFAEGLDGEIYVLETRIARVVVVPGGVTQFPPLLSSTGCFDPADPRRPLPGLIPYDVNAPLWSDGAIKRRWLALPDGAQITVGPDGDLDFPNGTVLLKEFSLGERPVETRLFVRHDDGGWAGYTYEWDEGGSDAALLEQGKVADVDGQAWTFPSRLQCLSCHTSAAGGSLGPTLGQLNRYAAYPSTQRRANQLRTLQHIGLFADPEPGHPAAIPILPGPDQTWAPGSDLARAYLEANCSNCHRPQGPTQSGMDLRASATLAEMAVCQMSPELGDLGLIDPLLLDPGHPERSILFVRPSSTDDARMPPLATDLVDTQGTQWIADWITSVAEDQGQCTGADSDADGWLDAIDHCPAVADASNLDTDGDGLGDVCQCGDVSGDGRLGPEDIAAYRGFLAGASSGLANPDRCNAWEDMSPCDLADLVVLTRAGGGLSPGAQPYCGAPDADVDGVRDAIDLCRVYPDFDQRDTDANGIGDACECGDQTGDGVVDIEDIQAISDVELGLLAPGPLCDANEDDLCDAADIDAIGAHILGGAPMHCARNPSGT